MEVKVLCGCGAKFAFDVEPVNGVMPVNVYCPKCSVDVTGFANQVISQKLAASAPVASPVGSAPAPGARLKVSGGHTTPAASPAAEAAPAAASNCGRHTWNVAASNCFVCQKPICLECMSQFGYLCSINCKYQAEQRGLRVPQYELQKSVVENRWWQKAGQISGLVALAVLLLISTLLWYLYSGSQPKTFYSLAFSPKKAPIHSEFVSKNEFLLLFPDKLVLHDIKAKKDVWTAPLSSKPDVEKEASSDEEEDEFDRPGFFRWGREPQLHLAKGDVWIVMPKQVLSFDLKSGARKQSIALPGELNRFNADDNAIFVHSTTEARKAALTRIDLATGTAKTEETIPTPVERQFFAEEIPPGVAPTAAYLLESEFASEEQRKRAMKTVYSKFLSTGANAVEMQVRMVQPNLVYVEAMKKPGNSSLNATTSAATAPGIVAEEIFNDLKRSKTGGLKGVDESRYRVTLRRLLEEVEPWTGEVTGPPAFFPMKTVDVLVAGKMAIVFTKQNKKLFEAKLTYPVADWMISATGYSPFVEEDNTLYFFDQGVLTAFDLPGGNVRWRLTSVGITKVVSDGDGNLYVASTTGSPEDIQYSEQIKMEDAAKPVLIKVDAKSGKKLWQSLNLADCELSGKYIYAMNQQSGGFGLAQGLSEALGSYSSGADHFRVFRVDSGSGKRKWEFYSPMTPEQIDFEGNRMLLRFPNEIRVVKHLTF